LPPSWACLAGSGAVAQTCRGVGGMHRCDKLLPHELPTCLPCIFTRLYWMVMAVTVVAALTSGPHPYFLLGPAGTSEGDALSETLRGAGTNLPLDDPASEPAVAGSSTRRDCSPDALASAPAADEDGVDDTAATRLAACAAAAATADSLSAPVLGPILRGARGSTAGAAPAGRRAAGRSTKHACLVTTQRL
jgi:hypothetical protein